MPPFVKTGLKCTSVSLVKHKITGIFYLRYQELRITSPNWGHKKSRGQQAARSTRTVYESTGEKQLRKADSAMRRKAAELESTRAETIGRVGRKRVDDAMSEAISTFSRARTEAHKLNMAKCANLFIAYLRARYQRRIMFWDEITPVVARGYIDVCAKRGLSARTIHAYLNVVKLTSRYMAELDAKTYQPLHITHKATRIPKPLIKFLDIDDLELCLRIAREEMHTDFAELAIMLAGYCGLRLREVCRLKFSDFDFKRETVDVHDSKNDWSERKIPVPQFVTLRVHELMRARAIGNRHWLVFRVGGAPGIAEENVCKPITRVLRRAHAVLHPDDFPLDKGGQRKAGQERIKGAGRLIRPPCIGGVSPRNLRTTFANIGVAAGVGSMELQCYMGHRPDTVLAQHYADYSGIELLRDRVVHPVERARENALSRINTSAKMISVG